MARWIRFEKTAWSANHRGGDDGAGNVRFDRNPCPTVGRGLTLSGTAQWYIEDDGEPEDGDVMAPTDPTKPPYRVPLLEEIRAMPEVGLTCMSTFSGCGGSCLGFRWAGWRHLLAVEFVPSAVESYQANYPGVPVWTEDIRELTVERALELMGVEAGELDCLEGSPPCESFSTSGKRQAGWGQVRAYSDSKQQVMDDLFYEYARLLGGIQPRTFVAENVSGLVKGVSKGYFKRIHAALEEQGYDVSARMLDAQWLGVPQRRARVIFVGTRKDLGLDPTRAFPSPLPYRYSIREALTGLGHAEVSRVIRNGHGHFAGAIIDADQPAPTIQRQMAGTDKIERIVFENGGRGGASQDGRAEEDLDAPIRTITNAHAAATHFKIVETVTQKIAHGDTVDDNVAASLDGYAVGDEWAKIGPGGKSDRYQNLVRPTMDETCPTVTAQGVGAVSGAPGGVASVCHPDEPRKFSIAELMRLCGFPDDFKLEGTYAQRWERLGNSVPPPMMYHVAVVLRDVLLARQDSD